MQSRLALLSRIIYYTLLINVLLVLLMISIFFGFAPKGEKRKMNDVCAKGEKNME